MKLFLLLALAHNAPAPCANKEFGQCGGSGWSGDTCCPDYDECKTVNAYFSQCMPKNLCLNPMYGQCGGMDNHQPPRPWTPANHHQTCCPPSFECSFQSQYYSQCVFNTTANTTCATAYQQCGGEGWTGKTCCIPGFECTPDAVNPRYYSGCKPLPICTNARFGQCGGVDADNHPWTQQYGHDSCCPEGFECQYKSQYYSQCVKNTTAAASTAVEEAKAKYARVDARL